MPDSGTESKSKQTILLSRLSVILPVLAGVMADVIAFYVRDTSSGLLFSLLSMLIYIIYMGVRRVFRYVRQEKQLRNRKGYWRKMKDSWQRKRGSLQKAVLLP